MNAADLKNKIETALAEAKARGGYDYAVLLCEAHEIHEAMPRLLNLELPEKPADEDEDEWVEDDAERADQLRAACITALTWHVSAADCIRAFPATYGAEDARRLDALRDLAAKLSLWTHESTETGDDDIDAAAHGARCDLLNRI